MWKISIMKTLKYWRKKLRRTLEDGKTFHVHGLEESLLWNWLSCQKPSRESMQSQSKPQWHSSQKKEKKVLKLMQSTRPQITKAILSNNKLEVSPLVASTLQSHRYKNCMELVQKSNLLINGIEQRTPVTRPYNYRHLIFDKNTHWRKESIFNNQCWGN